MTPECYGGYRGSQGQPRYRDGYRGRLRTTRVALMTTGLG